MLIDVHAHFYTDRSPRADWAARNRARLTAGDRIGITHHVASILGTWGARSPTYFPSPDDVTHGNDAMAALARDHPPVRAYCVVNPNYPDHAAAEIDRRLAEGFIGIKLAASRRSTDPLLDSVAETAAARGVPVLHHVWQHRRRDWPGQEASDGPELIALAARHPHTQFILAHIGGGGDWAHTLRAMAGIDNVWVDLSGSGMDVDMLDATIRTVGPRRMVWGADVTLDTGLAKLRYLEAAGLADNELELIRAGNARSIFPEGTFDADR